MGCGCDNNTNPCGAAGASTAACETLPSQIENFTKQFFGVVTKSEINGVVTWSLPCGLDVGLENNPRAEGEGLACYFQRLFQEGIIGLTGPVGGPGAPGLDGYNAFTVLLASFTQPSLAAPGVQVSVFASPAILPGMHVFVQGAGWYLVGATDGLGTVWMNVTRLIALAGSVVPAGRLVAPSGYPGASVTGLQGPQGTKGDQGNPGASFTATNSQVDFFGGTNYNFQVADAGVNFGTGALQVLLPDAGTYLITAVVSLVGLAGVLTTDVVELRLRNTTDAVDLAGSYQSTSRIADGERRVVTIPVVAAVSGVNRTVRLQGQCTTADKVSAVAVSTILSYVRIA